MNKTYFKNSQKTAGAITLCLVLWLVFAPMQFAGQLAYIIVFGNSMLPTVKDGDLVLVRPAAVYQSGDIIAYRFPELGTVLHRVIEKKFDRYLLQGDNNEWVDSYQPTQKDIIGKYWFKIPGIGNVFRWLRQPAVMAALMGLTVLLLGMSYFETPHYKRKKKSTPREANLFKAFTFLFSNQHCGILIPIYSIGFISIILGIAAFSQPLERRVADDLPYQQSGSFSYSGSAPAGVYDQNAVTTGNAVFPQLTCLIDMDFEYQLQSQAAFSGLGTYQVNAEVSSDTGWLRTMPLHAPASFTGTGFITQMQLNVCRAQKMIQQMEELTGAHNLRYWLVVKPQINYSGYLNERPIKDSFSPELRFLIESQQIYLWRGDMDGTDPLNPLQAGVLAGFKSEPNQLNVFGMAVPVWLARLLAILGTVLAACGLGIRAHIVRRVQETDECYYTKMMLGDRVVESQGRLVFPHERVIDLSSRDDLVRLAELLGTIVFFHQEDGCAYYFIRDDWVVYRYHKTITKPDGLFADMGSDSDEIRHAVEKEQLTLYYQPVVSMNSGAIVYLEALVRWDHPDRGMLLPGVFLPEAAQAGLQPAIDQWVLEHASAQLKNWLKTGVSVCPLSINVSIHELQQTGYAKKVEEHLTLQDIPPNLLRIEIEKSEFEVNPIVLENLQQLDKLGIGITIKLKDTTDVNHLLSQHKISHIKIGRPLVRRMISDRQFGESVQLWLETARERDIHVTAVGIETIEQYEFFKQNNLQAAQGYLICPPLPAAAIQQQLKEGVFMNVDRSTQND